MLRYQICAWSMTVQDRVNPDWPVPGGHVEKRII